jgi:hypothetical protein
MMDFFDRFALYTQAVGLEDVAVAWDLANVPLSNEKHYELASVLGGWALK